MLIFLTSYWMKDIVQRTYKYKRLSSSTEKSINLDSSEGAGMPIGHSLTLPSHALYPTLSLRKAD